MASRLRALLLTPVPFGFRTMALAFFMGSILSLPLGLLIVPFRPFTPPEWTAPFYDFSVLGSFLVLPFWSLLAFRREPLLRKLGIRYFVLSVFILIFGGLLFPAVQ